MVNNSKTKKLARTIIIILISIGLILFVLIKSGAIPYPKWYIIYKFNKYKEDFVCIAEDLKAQKIFVSEGVELIRLSYNSGNFASDKKDNSINENVIRSLRNVFFSL